MAKILLLEDDLDAQELLTEHLTRKNYSVEAVTSGEEALDRLLTYHYDLAIFDWSVKGMSGLHACQQYRRGGGVAPVLMLTGKSQMAEKLSGFDAGVDDYLVKPYSPEELHARIRALLARPRQRVSKILEFGDLILNQQECSVIKSGQQINLTAKEFALLELLMANRNRVFSAADLLERLWSSESDSSESAAQKCFSRLRLKIDGSDNGKGYLITVKGLGYKFASE